MYLPTVIGLFALVVSVEATTHAIVVPKKISPGQPIPVSITLNATGVDQATVQFDLIRNDHERISTLTKNFTKDGNGVMKGQLEIPVPDDLEPDTTYRLLVHGLYGSYFIEHVRLVFSKPSVIEQFDVFIQTDKAIYKPGQTVRFRVFGTFSNMTMYTDYFNVYIKDPNGNRIKQWSLVNSEYGVVENFMLMDTEPSLGDWIITAETNDTVLGRIQARTKTFTVGEYVLPKFEVDVVMPDYVLTSDKDLKVTVKAKYTYGKPVEGTVLVSADLDYNNSPWKHFGNETMVETTVDIDGEVDVTIPLTRIASEVDPYSYIPLVKKLNGYHVLITATVTESINKISRNATGSTRFYEHPYNVAFTNSQNYFKPGLPYTTYVKITQADGRPVMSNSTDVTLTTYYKFYDKSTYKSRATALPDRRFTPPVSGILAIDMVAPVNADSLHFEVHYKGYTATTTINKLYGLRDGTLDVSTLSSTAAVGEKAEFTIQSTDIISWDLWYMITSYDSLVITSGQIAAPHRKSFTFDVMVTEEMEPYAQLLVYYIRSSDSYQYNADSVYFSVNDGSTMFKNKVDLYFNESRAQPGDVINLHINTGPSSLVNLLAVDQSVLLLKTGNDIEQSDVISALASLHAPADTNSHHQPRQLLQYASAFDVLSDYEYFPWAHPHYKRQIDCVPGARPTAMPMLPSGQTPTAQPSLPPGRFPTYVPNIIPTPAPGQTYAPGQFPTYVPGMVPTPAASLKSVQRIRTKFPETFIWTNVTADASGNASLTVAVPDTITSWVANAFAVSKTSGLGIANTPAKFTTFRPFFVSLNLPYSVIRGEQLVLQANVFNYLQKDLFVMVTLERSNNFKVIQPIKGTNQTIEENVIVHRNITVKAGSAKAVYIPIIPTTIGQVGIAVMAQSVLSADGVRRSLLVKPEGVEVEYTESMILAAGQKASVIIATPPAYVPNSEIIRVSVIGDVMGQSVKNMNNLLRMPTGCGEQTMSSMAPDVLITRYLNSTNQLTDTIRDQAIAYMEKGYQRELTFQHYDGSFSIWGRSDRQGSMWLTAFVVKTFQQASEHIYIDERVISRATSWITRHMNYDGSAQNIGYVHDSLLQGGARLQFSLTAFVLMALTEVDTPAVAVTAARARAFLEANLHSLNDPYELAIVSYALTRSGSSLGVVAFNKLDTQAFIRTDSGKKHWSRTFANPTVASFYWASYYHRADPHDIETAAYGLLYLIHSHRAADGLPVLKWLLAQRNERGGFSSTQDTVVALQAISEYQNLFTGPQNLDVLATAGLNFSHTFNVQRQDALVLKTQRIPANALPSQSTSPSSARSFQGRQAGGVILRPTVANPLHQATTTTVPGSHSGTPYDVNLSATGSGSALTSVSVSYHVQQAKQAANFNVKAYIKLETLRSLTLEACFEGSITPTYITGSTGMHVLEVGIPTGFVVELESPQTDLTDSKKSELKDHQIVLYYEQLLTRTCATLEFIRTDLVARTKPAPITGYQYYRPENKAVTFYESQILKDASICDICSTCGC